jgi:hypothetical protein
MSEPEYLQALGAAVYVFARVEWNVMYIVERLRPGYLMETNENGKLPDQRTPSTIANDLKAALKKNNLVSAPMRTRIEDAHALFKKLSLRRNHLFHAHPFTDADGKQRLGKTEERHWTLEKISVFVAQLEAADRETNALVHELPGALSG